MSSIKIVAFAGSARGESSNRKLLAVAIEIARELGCKVDLADLRDYPMPIYDGDHERENGQPRQAIELKARILDGDALLMACPEYNASITPLLKNTIDWLSRPQPDEPNAFKARPTALLSASAGALGGLRGLFAVRTVLLQLGALTIPTQFALGSAFSAFDDDGRLINDAQRNLVKDVIVELDMIADALRWRKNMA